MLDTFIYILRLIWHSSPKYRTRISLGVFNSIFKGVSMFFVPFYLGLFVQSLSQNLADAKRFFFIFIIWSFVIGIHDFLYRRYFERLDSELNYSTILEYFVTLYRRHFLWHVDNSTGFMTSTIKRIGSNIERIVVTVLWNHIPHLSAMTVFLAYSSSLSWYLSTYFFVFAVILILVARITYEKRIVYAKKRARKFSLFDKLFVDFLYNVKTLKQLFIKGYAEKKMRETKEQVLYWNKKVYDYNSYQWLFLDFAVMVIFFAPTTYYFSQTLSTGKHIDTIIVILTTMMNFREFIRNFMTLLMHLSYDKADFFLIREKMNACKNSHSYEVKRKSLRVLLKKLSTNPLKKKKSISIKKSQSPSIWNKISFDNVSYIYKTQGRESEHTIPSLEIYKGDKILVTGMSGSGKTTFLNILAGNIIPDRGSVCVNNTNISYIPEKCLAQNITYLSQDIELFDTTLKENILMGKHISEQKISQIIQKVGLDNLVNRLDLGLNTKIGEKGAKVSAGEKQKINIARGLVFKRNVLIFDEVTAHLDMLTAQKIWKYIFNTCKKRTIIVVTHRPKELLKHADRHLIFEKGKLVADKHLQT